MPTRFSNWRMRLVSTCVSIIVCVLFYRIIQIQILRHERYNEIAKRQWHRKVKWPARRGSIYDRNGYPLAVSHKTYDIGVTPCDLPSDDGTVTYLAGILGKSESWVKRHLRKKSKYVLLAKDVSLTGEQEARLSSFSGVKLDSGPERLNPLSSISSSFIGGIDHKGVGNAGVELAFQEYLQGRDGWILVNRDAKDQAFRPINAPGREAVDGHDIYLTIDSGIQSIVDFELEQAVERYGAAGGVAIVVDPDCGDLIAISEKSGSSGGKKCQWYGQKALYSTSCIFEPGSTFKMITDAFLLESGKIDPYDVYYGEKGNAEFDFGKFNDDHPYEWLTFKESFVYSSNICTIKAVEGSDRRDFYSFLLNLGFGGRTGIDLPAESKGQLSEPGDWSNRSLASISIGQEVGVTAMQMVMAYAALANGGRLLTPRVALGVKDSKNRLVKSFPVIEARQVFSASTTETMIDFCRSVVREGTGKKASVNGVEVAGKTGTAQKSDGRTYIRGSYVSSFIGFAPAEDPKLVCLVLLDEPDQSYHYGGLSAAVAFRKIIEGINLSTDLLVDRSDSRLAIGNEDSETKKVPNFLRMSIREAEKLSAESGFRIQYSSSGGEVFSQIPGPGTAARDDEVSLAFRIDGEDRSRKISVPDLRGLPIRKARRMLIECGLRSTISGYGIVERQHPGPGNKVLPGDLVELRCVPKIKKRSYAANRDRSPGRDLARRAGVTE